MNGTQRRHGCWLKKEWQMDGCSAQGQGEVMSRVSESLQLGLTMSPSQIHHHHTTPTTIPHRSTLPFHTHPPQKGHTQIVDLLLKAGDGPQPTQSPTQRALQRFFNIFAGHMVPSHNGTSEGIITTKMSMSHRWCHMSEANWVRGV